MSKKWVIINLLLLAGAGALAWQLSTSIRRFRLSNDISKIQPVADPKRLTSGERGLPALQPVRRYNPPDFAGIPAQNIFSDSRSNQKEEVKVVQEAPELRVKPVLVGVTMFGDQRYAIITQTQQAPAAGSGGRRGQTKRLGDVYEGYTIVDITEDKMVLQYGSRREIIPLFDSTKQRDRSAKTPLIATRVVNFGGGSASPLVVSSPGAPPRPSSQPGAPTLTVIGGTPQQTSPGGLSGVTAPSIRPMAQTPIQQTPAGVRGVDTQTNRRVIQTPMGEFVTYPP